jgi:hypothetical protein
VIFYCHAKDDEKYTWQDSIVAVEDVVQGNKGQATIATEDNHDVG